MVKVTVLLLCFDEEGQTGKIPSETVVAPRYKLLGITVTLLTLIWSKRAFMPIYIMIYGLLSEMLEWMGEWSV